MKQITANSVGMNWRSDVFNAANFDSVLVIDLDGRTLGRVHTSKDGIGRTSIYLNGQRTTHKRVWEMMHKWSDVIALQNARYRVTSIN